MYPDQNQDLENRTQGRPPVFGPTPPQQPQGGWPSGPTAPPSQSPYQSNGWGTPPQPGGFQQPYQQNQMSMPQTPAPLTPEYGGSDGGPRFSPLRLIMLIIIILVVLAGLGVGGLVLYKHFNKKPVVTPKAIVPVALAARQLCSRTGIALTCQDLSTGTASKYEAPHEIGAAYAILPSPDDTKVFIDSPANTVKDPTVSDKLAVYDKQLKLIKQLPDEKATEDYLGFDWTADSKTLVYAKREMNDQKQFGKASLYTYNLDTGETKQLAGGDTYDFSVPQVGRSGDTVYIENNAGTSNGMLSLAAVSLSSGKVQTIASGSVMQAMQSFTTYSYSRIHNLFYISGTSAATGKPVFIIAKLATADNGSLQLQTVKVLDDGYTYTPLTSTADGMLVSRASEKAMDYGLIKTDGTFTTMDVSPSANAPFGLASLFSLKAADNSSPVAADFLYEDSAKAPPVNLAKFLTALVTKNCPAKTYNTVALLGQDAGKQAAVHFTPCNSDTDRTQYYIQQNGSYKNVLETQATTIPCATMAKLKLTKAIVPSCSKP